MKNMSRHTGTLKLIKRLPASTNGNPRWLLSVDGVTCHTAVDSSLGYYVTNHDGKCVTAIIGAHYGKATLHRLL